MPAPVASMMEQEARPDKGGDAFATLTSVEKVLVLFRHVGTLNGRITLEHSFKAIPGRLFGDRLLLGVQRAGMESPLDAGIASVCEEIGMPQNLLTSFVQSLPGANHVYFGAEKNEKTLLFKAYVEFRDKIEKEIGGTTVTGRSYALFTGFKWDTSSPSRQAVTRYDWYPYLPVPAMIERMRTIVDPDRHRALLEVVPEIVERASDKIPCGDIQYLEVTEEGNPRRSFDINLYKTGHALEDVHSPLRKAARHYAIPPDRFDALYERIKSERLGHVAGGVDREDRDFMTVYYGVKPIESSRLRSATVGPGGGKLS